MLVNQESVFLQLCSVSYGSPEIKSWHEEYNHAFGIGEKEFWATSKWLAHDATGKYDRW